MHSRNGDPRRAGTRREQKAWFGVRRYSCPEVTASEGLPPGHTNGRAHTQSITLDADVVHKRFTSWNEGEPDREWAGLTALARYCPGLAPTPITRDIKQGAPVVVMSRVPGAPLGKDPLTAPQVDALRLALCRLFSAPVDPQTTERAMGPSVMRSFVRQWAGEDYQLGPCSDPTLVRSALAMARGWLAVDDPTRHRVTDAVLAVGDGNLEHVLWDGITCRLIDFEEFGSSDLAYELADVVEHASSRLRRLFDIGSFLDGLCLTADQQSRLTAYRQLMAAFWLVMLLPGNAGFDRNPAAALRTRRNTS